MIIVLTGDNSFELTRALEVLTQDFAGDISRADGSEIDYEKLVDLTSSLSLFADKRMVIVRDLSANKSVWQQFGDNLDRVSDDTQLVLIEPSLDKRTTTYKRLQKAADIRTFSTWGDRDSARAEQWTAEQAAQLGVGLDRKAVQMLVRRVSLDQWQLYHALEKLAVLDTVNESVIEQTIEAQASENVFELLDAALKGDTRRVSTMIRHLQITEDPYRVLGLLASQVFQLAALAVATEPSATVAKDIGAHPFVLSRMAPTAQRLGRRGAQRAVAALAEADTDSKSLSVDTWLLIERALLKIATIA